MRMRSNFGIFFEITKMGQTFLFKRREFRKLSFPLSDSDPTIATGPTATFSGNGSVNSAMILISEVPFVFGGGHRKVLPMHGNERPVAILFLISNLILPVFNPEETQYSALLPFSFLARKTCSTEGAGFTIGPWFRFFIKGTDSDLLNIMRPAAVIPKTTDSSI